MPKRTGSANQELQALIAELRSRGYREGSKFLLKMAEELAKPARSRAKVNVSRLERFCKAKEDVIIPGKLLADGSLTKQLTVSCLGASESARKKIESAGGKVVSIEQAMERNPSGKNMRIIC